MKIILPKDAIIMLYGPDGEYIEHRTVERECVFDESELNAWDELYASNPTRYLAENNDRDRNWAYCYQYPAAITYHTKTTNPAVTPRMALLQFLVFDKRVVKP